ncbi:MAG: phosphatase PAP2 family protein [Clostridia bacterium]|nr:phosphatase PAP2 family protein [Clostridia bacterium]
MKISKLPKTLIPGIAALGLFAVWTAAVCLVDTAPIGPEGSEVGLATVNGFFHRLTGVHMSLYTLTDWLSLVPFGFIFGFALLGLVQLISRKKLFRVDGDILLLGCFYVAVMAAYALFEFWAVNYRPVLINGVPEPSYPSSTTMLVLCVMPTAIAVLSRRLKCKPLRGLMAAVLSAYTAFLVLGRLVSGVHWLSDIAGGVLLSAGLVGVYLGAVELLPPKK